MLKYIEKSSQYIYSLGMIVKSVSILDILEIAIDSGCSQYKTCEGCKHVSACMDLWNGIYGGLFTTPMTKDQLKDYVNGLNEFLKERSRDCQGSPASN